MMFGFGMPQYMATDSEEYKEVKDTISDDIVDSLNLVGIDLDDVVDRRFGFISIGRLKSHDKYSDIPNETLKLIYEDAINIENDIIDSHQRVIDFFAVEFKSPISKQTYGTFIDIEILEREIETTKEHIDEFKETIMQLN